MNDRDTSAARSSASGSRVTSTRATIHVPLRNDAGFVELRVECPEWWRMSPEDRAFVERLVASVGRAAAGAHAAQDAAAGGR